MIIGHEAEGASAESRLTRANRQRNAEEMCPFPTRFLDLVQGFRHSPPRHDGEKTTKRDGENCRVVQAARLHLPVSEIYGGINGFWDYGPAGAELKRNIKDAWWNDVVRSRTDVVGLDGTIIMHPRVWEASGHTTAFTDPMVDCKACKKRYRADQLCEENGQDARSRNRQRGEKKFKLPEGVVCPACGSKDLTEPRPFNLMFKTFVGPVEEESAWLTCAPRRRRASSRSF